jgi:hypothetical protein
MDLALDLAGCGSGISRCAERSDGEEEMGDP